MPQLYPLRVVEMQLTAKVNEPPDDPWAETNKTPQNETVRAYEARRCHVCGCQYPPFGFAPPMTRPGTELWACQDHKDEVRRSLDAERGGSFGASGDAARSPASSPRRWAYIHDTEPKLL